MSRYDEKLPRLEYYSQQFAKRLFARHPEWKQYEGRYATGEPGLLSYFLELKIPSANPQVVMPLIIRTCPKEVYIQWVEPWHVHISFGPKKEKDEYYRRALEDIDLLVSDEYLFANVYKDGICVEGWGSRVGADIGNWLQPAPGQITVVRSWRGTYDAEF